MVKIQVLVPSYNCQDWIERCLESIKIQDYTNYNVLVIDDASTQINNRRRINRFVRKGGDNWAKQFNEVNLKCPANLYYGIEMMKPEREDVIFLLDGDDFLPHPGVFSRIAQAYENPHVWLTYGNYVPHPENTGQVPAEQYSAREITEGDFRTRILFNHPLTFKYFLWMQIPLSCMKYPSGVWLDVGYDRSIMFPMLEMARERHLFIDEPLYAYNAVNPLSDVHVRIRAAQKVHRYLAKTPKQDRLPDEARYW